MRSGNIHELRWSHMREESQTKEYGSVNLRWPWLVRFVVRRPWLTLSIVWFSRRFQ